MIKALLIKGCPKCENLKKQLEENKINYIETYCEDDESICDYVESLIDSYEYPIILNVNSKQEIKEIFYRTDKYSRLKETKVSNATINALGFYSIDELIKFVIK